MRRRTGEPLLVPSRRSWWASSVMRPAPASSSPHMPRATLCVIELSPPSAISRRVLVASSATRWITRASPSGPSGSRMSPPSRAVRSATSMSCAQEYVEYRARASRIAVGVRCACVALIDVREAGTPRTVTSAASAGRRVGQPGAGAWPARIVAHRLPLRRRRARLIRPPIVGTAHAPSAWPNGQGPRASRRRPAPTGTLARSTPLAGPNDRARRRPRRRSRA